MIDIILAILCPSILAFLLVVGRRENAHQQAGWGYIFAGFSFVICGVLIGITDSFFGLENSITVRGTEYRSFMATMAGFFPGFLLLAVGFWKWVPGVRGVREQQSSLETVPESIAGELESDIEKYTVQLEDLEGQLELELLRGEQAEKFLHESEERYWTLLDRVSDGVCLLRDGRIEYANCRMLDLTGYDPDEMIGASMTNYVHPDSIPKFTECLDRCISDLVPGQNWRVMLSHRDGIKVEVEINASDRACDGKQVNLLVLHDITGSRQAEEKSMSQNEEIQWLSRDLRKTSEELRIAQEQLSEVSYQLREREGEFSAFMENAVDPVFCLDLDGKITNVNSRIENIFGYKRSMVMGKGFADIGLFTPEDLLKMTEALSQVVEGKIIPLREFEARHRNGEAVYIETRPRLIDIEGESKSILVVMQDNSERKRLEDALQRDREELGERVRDRTGALNRASKELQIEASARRRAESLLQESEARWDSLVENSNDIITIVHRDGKIVSINRILSGVISGQVIGALIYDYLHPEYRRKMKNVLERVFREGVAANCEIVGVGPNNIYCWYETKIGPVKHGGQVIAATLVATDVTERKWAQKTLQESEQRFRELADLLPQTVFEIDMSGNFIFANNAGLQHTGYIQEDIDKGLNLLQLFIPEDRKRVMKDIEKVLKGEEFGSHEYTGLRKDGGTFRVLAYSSPIIREETIVGMRGIILDITERKLAEEQVAQRNRELGALNAITQTVNQSFDLNEILNKALDKILEIMTIEHGGIYLLDKESNNLILTISKGISSDLLEVITPVRMGVGIPGIVVQSGESMLVESISDSVELIGERIQKIAIGEHVKSVMCLPLQTRGKVLGVMFAMTQGERIFSLQEQQLMITISHAMSTAIENIQLMESESRVMASEEADQLRAAFISSISHEIRTPLTEIKGFASTLIQPDVEWDAETQRDFLIGINQASDRLLDVVNDVFDMSKIQAGVLKLEKRPVNLLKLIERLRTKFDTPTWRGNLHLQIPNDLPNVSVDEERLEQVIINLVNNAAQEGAPITIKAEVLDGNLVVNVIDSGKGISPERLGKVFDHFHGLEDNTEHRRSGSGLKLTVSRGIVEAHGGRIWAESELGIGSKFSFALPVGVFTELSPLIREESHSAFSAVP